MIEERAKELVDRHYKILTKNYADSDLAQILAHNMWFEEAKKCALITVDEIITELSKAHFLTDLTLNLEFWQEVKKEISNINTQFVG